jgi:hypothetical protein
MGDWRASELRPAPTLVLLVAITIGCGDSEPAKPAPEESGGSSHSGGSGAGGGPSGGASSGGSSLAGAGGTSAGALATAGSAGSGGSASGAGGSGGSASGAGGSGGSGGSASGAGGSAGESGDCTNARAYAEPGIVASIAGQTIEFREDLLWYDGRPPLLDLSALSEEAGWTSFRIVIDPGDDVVVPGRYESGPGNVTYVQARAESGEYDSVDNDLSIICVNEAGTGAGARVSGTFSATLENYDGSRSFKATGTFSGTIEAE